MLGHGNILSVVDAKGYWSSKYKSTIEIDWSFVFF